MLDVEVIKAGAMTGACATCFVLGLSWLATRIVGWVSSVSAVVSSPDEDVVFDTAGLPYRVATSVEHVEVAANKLSSVGFLAMSLRVSEDAALTDAEYDYAVDKVEVAATRLEDELRLCRECRRWGGEHGVGCVEVAEMLRMDGDEMLSAEKEDPKYG